LRFFEEIGCLSHIRRLIFLFVKGSFSDRNTKGSASSGTVIQSLYVKLHRCEFEGVSPCSIRD
ncbi:MAG: hypothetical protein JW795_16780, partial [Chitinivibrionales bacterium]|nr:hypothetical protein [Chitinivibrionales bacterium]